MTTLKTTAVLALGLFLCGIALADDCHPPLKADWQQYIVGYGSLMEAESKQMTEPNAGASWPGLSEASHQRICLVLAKRMLNHRIHNTRLIHFVPLPFPSIFVR